MSASNHDATASDAVAPRWIRPERWKQLTGMSHGQMIRHLWNGELRAVRIGRAWYIDAKEVEAFFERAAQAA